MNEITKANYRQRYTGAELIAEAKLNRVELAEPSSLEEYIISLLQHLTHVLDIGMNGIDYHRLKKAEIATAMRYLAIIINSLDERLVELTN